MTITGARRGHLLWLTSVLACQGVSEGALEVANQRLPVIYDRDDRIEVYAVEDAGWQLRATASVVAFVPAGGLRREADGSFVPTALPGPGPFCPEERFADQPTVAACSGVLIAPDRVLSSAHCFTTLDCSQHSVVFNYFYEAEDQLAKITDDEVFRCQEVIAQQQGLDSQGRRLDYAIIQLDRAVGQERVVASTRLSPLVLGEQLTVIGYPSGLPAKIDSGAVVRSVRAFTRDFFELDSDTFVNSSGSGVFDRNGYLVGVLVRGTRDYTWERGCAEAIRLSADEVAGWEHATYVAHPMAAVEHLQTRPADPSHGCSVGGRSKPWRSSTVTLWGILWLASIRLYRWVGRRSKISGSPKLQVGVNSGRRALERAAVSSSTGRSWR